MVRSATTIDRPLAADLRFARDRIIVLLKDGREVGVPLSWYPTLAAASDADRSDWHLMNDGDGVHWPQLDLDLSVNGIVSGQREVVPRPPSV